MLMNALWLALRQIFGLGQDGIQRIRPAVVGQVEQLHACRDAVGENGLGGLTGIAGAGRELGMNMQIVIGYKAHCDFLRTI